MKNKSRRQFVKTAGLASAGFMIVPRHVLGKGFTAPSDQLTIAAIACGGKGYSDIKNAYNNGQNRVIALCDFDSHRAKEARTLFPKAMFFKDARKMFDQMGKKIDAVTISTPDHTHAYYTLLAMQQGIHTYVQKPLTHNIQEARILTEAARKHKIVTQMGNQGASSPDQQKMKEWFEGNKIGLVKDVYVWTNRPVWPQGIHEPNEFPGLPTHITQADWDCFIGPAKFVDYHPLYHPFKWHGWWNLGTGALGDMGCHLIDPAFKLLNLNFPSSVESSVTQVFTQDWVPDYLPKSCPQASITELEFPKTEKTPTKIKLRWYDGGIRPPRPDIIPEDAPLAGENGSNGVLMIGEKGVMTCGVYGLNPKVYTYDGEILTMNPKTIPNTRYTSLPEYGHQVAWADACKSGFGSKEHLMLTSSFDYAGPLTETVLMGNLAIRSYELREASLNGRFKYQGRKKLLWNGQDMSITNFNPANAFVTREYRKNYELPKI